jgi:putative flippase GtrA
MNPAFSRMMRFVMVGGTGFAVDAILLKTIVVAGLAEPIAARVFSIAVAGLVTWQLNRNFTFAPSGDSQLSEATRYGGVVVAASLVNYVIYAGLMLAMPSLEPLIALVVSSIGAMGFSYIGYDRFVFWNASYQTRDLN